MPRCVGAVRSAVVDAIACPLMYMRAYGTSAKMLANRTFITAEYNPGGSKILAKMSVCSSSSFRKVACVTRNVVSLGSYLQLQQWKSRHVREDVGSHVKSSTRERALGEHPQNSK